MRIAAWMLTAGILLACPAGADEVVLDNGSRIIGTVTRLVDGVLTIETDFAGALNIDAARVTGLTTAEALTVQLDSGDRVTGSLRYVPGTGQRVSSALGESDIDVAQLDGLWGVGEDAPEVSALRDELAKARDSWSLSAAIGVNGQSGNTERVAAIGRVEAERTTDRERLLLYAQARYGQENGVESTKEFLGGIDFERDITDRWFCFGALELENDRFEDLTLRASGVGGAGYFFIREDDQELKLRGGVGFLSETFTDETSDSEIIAEATLDYRLDVSDWFCFTHRTSYYPTFHDLGDYRLIMENAGEIPLTDDEVWKLRLGIRHQYDARPNPGIERLDTYYFLNFVAEIE